VKTEDVELVAALCRTRAGLKVDRDKPYLIESRLAPLARREGFGSIVDLVAALRASRDDSLIWALVEAMASTETAFFRDREAFALLRDEVLPALSHQREGEPIRVWSAACSTGQEAYSLAILADAAHRLAPGARVEIFASDLSERALEKAQSGLYTQFEVQRGLPIRLLLQHFDKDGEAWALSPRIRQRVRWKRVNLLGDLAELGEFDLILARNIVTGLDAAARGRVLENLAGALAPEGVLMLGAQETATEAPDALRPDLLRRGFYSRHPSFQAAAA
jgi:chemotaxis protein methyltransferase CheR